MSTESRGEERGRRGAGKENDKAEVLGRGGSGGGGSSTCWGENAVTWVGRGHRLGKKKPGNKFSRWDMNPNSQHDGVILRVGGGDEACRRLTEMRSKVGFSKGSIPKLGQKEN